MACLKAKYIGNSENYILQESSEEFREMFFEAEPPPADAPKTKPEVYNFRSTAAGKMEDLVNSVGNIGAPVKREAVTIQGGC